MLYVTPSTTTTTTDLSVDGVRGGGRIGSISMKMSQFLKCHSHCRVGTILLKVKTSQRSNFHFSSFQSIY